MEILLTINKAYVKAAATTIYSISKKTKRIINFYVSYWDSEILSSEDKKILKKACKKNNLIFLPIKFLNAFKKIDCNIFNKTILLRIVALQSLPNSIERAIYIDSDIILKRNIESLFNKDLSTHTICGAEELYSNTHARIKKLNITDNIYLNSGFLLVNIPRYKKEYYNFINFIIKNSYHSFEYPDQDLFNMYFDLKKCTFENIMYAPYVPWSDEKDSYIYHYIGYIKPWNIKYQGLKYGNKYWKMAIKFFGINHYLRWIYSNIKRRIIYFSHNN